MITPRRFLADSLPKSHQQFFAGFAYIGATITIWRTLLALIPEADTWGMLGKGLLLLGTGIEVALAFLVVLSIYALKGVYQKFPEAPDPHRRLCLLDGEMYGLIRKKHKTYIEIEDDFSGAVHYESTIKAIASRVDGIEHFTAIPSRPEEVKEDIHTEAKAKEEVHTHVKPEIVRQTPHETFIKLNFVPPLQRDREIVYTYEQKLPEGTFVSSAEGMRKRSLAFDYCTDLITYPTEQLHSTIVFPKGFVPQWLGYDVWTGKAQVRHMSEYVRLESVGAFVSGYTEHKRLYICLDVSNPIRGLIYVLCWMPPKGGQQLPLKVERLPLRAAPEQVA